MEKLFRLMEKLPDEMLGRIQRAEKWVKADLRDIQGGRCLIGHAVTGVPEAIDVEYPYFEEQTGLKSADVYGRFDDLARKQTPEFVGRECSAKAAEILAARRARETAVVG